MLFNSINFIIFFPIVLMVYFLLPYKIRNMWLLIASYYFYMCWNAKYALLIFTSTVVTYFSGIIFERIRNINANETKKTKLKKLTVVGSLIINLGILFYFKYFNFAVDTLSRILSVVNIQLNIPEADALLPVGISFYTFQALSYTIDVYRGDIYAEKNFFQYALFVSFFPQLVAGPIERSKHLLKQLAIPHKFSIENAREGLFLMLWGYFLKLVIADRIALFVDMAYGDYESYPGVYLIIATVFFAFQVYCDFAGYSTIAMGTAKILGIDLMENFNAPYLSTSVAEFWRKWHISLTSWFKDYLYIPLGGNRKGKLRKYINILIVFLTSGLWHGARFTYIIWGGLNGLYQIVGEILKPLRVKVKSKLSVHTELFGHKLLQTVITFVLVDFALIFFRANRMADALGIIKSIFTDNNSGILLNGDLFTCGLDAPNFWLALVAIGVLIFADCCKRKGIVLRNIIIRQNWWFRIFFIVFSVCIILVFGKWGPTFDKASFIYFQF